MLSVLPVARHRREFNAYLRSLISDHQPLLLNRMIRYHLGWEDAAGQPQDAGGKGLRPTLCLLSCEAAGGEWHRALPAAAAVELVHNFSLIHDDVQDRDQERHHRPTVWSIWGEAQAINAGDGLLALARPVVLRLADEGVAAATVIEAARVLDESTLEMVAGQTLDLAFEEKTDVDLPAYLQMVRQKSGALFDSAFRLGVLTADGDWELAERLGRVGRTLGTAFQVRDDMLGVWGDESKTGKAAGADVYRRKKSLPVVYALSEGKAGTREELRAIYDKPALDADDVAQVRQHLDEVGARGYCERQAAELKGNAIAELGRLDLVPGPREEIVQIAEFLLEREF
ncbi:MAG: polyprenyl synthetase family protein [Chloroflexi bacterium]|nr:MAG: polyprenyl synthetase family protein [Chloroflexota bacterium]